MIILPKIPGEFSRQISVDNLSLPGGLCGLTGLAITNYKQPNDEWSREFAPGWGSTFLLHKAMPDGTVAHVKRVFRGDNLGWSGNGGHYHSSGGLSTGSIIKAMEHAEAYVGVNGLAIPRDVYNMFCSAPVTFTNAEDIRIRTAVRVGLIDVPGYRRHLRITRNSKAGPWFLGGQDFYRLGDAKEEATGILRANAMAHYLLTNADDTFKFQGDAQISMESFHDEQHPGSLTKRIFPNFAEKHAWDQGKRA